MEASDEDFLTSVGQFKDDVLDDLDVEEEEALLRFSEHEDSLLDEQERASSVEYVDEEGNPVEVNEGEKVEVVGQIERSRSGGSQFHSVDEEDVLEVGVDNDLDMFAQDTTKVTKELVPEEAEVSSSGLAVSGEEEEQAEEDEAKATASSSIDKDDEDEEEEGERGRNRFRNERQNIITLSKPRKRAHIPDTLESVLTEEEEAKATAFLNRKQEQQQRHRRPFGQGQGPGRPRHHLFHNQPSPMLHPRSPHQPQMCRPPPPWNGSPGRPRCPPTQGTFKAGPAPPPHVMETAANPFQRPYRPERPDGCPLPRKILINPHFKGPGSAPPVAPPPTPAPNPSMQQGSWHEDVNIEQLGQSFPMNNPILPDMGPSSQHSWPPPAPHPAPHHHHPQEPFYGPPPQQNFRHYQEAPRQQHVFHQQGPPYPLRDDPPLHHPQGPLPPHGLPPPVHGPPPPYPPPREPGLFQQGNNWNVSGCVPPPPQHLPPSPHGHGGPPHFNSRGFPPNRDHFPPEPPYPPLQPPPASHFGSPPLPPHQHQHQQQQHQHGPPQVGPPNHHMYLDQRPHDPHPPHQRYNFNDQQIPGGGGHFTSFQKAPSTPPPPRPPLRKPNFPPHSMNSLQPARRGLMVVKMNAHGQLKSKWSPHTSNLKSPSWQGKPKPEPRKTPVQSGNIKEVPIVESLDMESTKVEEEDEETRELRKKIEEQRKLREQVMRRKEERRRQMAAQRLQEVQARKNSNSGLVTIQPTETPATASISVPPSVAQQPAKVQVPVRTADNVLVNLQPATNRVPVKQRLGQNGNKKVLVIRKQPLAPQQGAIPPAVPNLGMPQRQTAPQERQVLPQTQPPMKRVPMQGMGQRQPAPGAMQQRMPAMQQRPPMVQRGPVPMGQHRPRAPPPPRVATVPLVRPRQPPPPQQIRIPFGPGGPVLKQLVPGRPGTLRQGMDKRPVGSLMPPTPNKAVPVRAPVPVRVTGQPAPNARPTVRPVGRGVSPPARTVMPGRRVIQVVKRTPAQEAASLTNKMTMVQQQQPPPARLVKMSQMTSVVISNLSVSASEAQLLKLCRTVGPVENIKLHKKDGKAVVKFKQGPHAEQFQKKFQRYMLDLSMIQVALLQI